MNVECTGKRPKDLGDGISMGLSSAGKGLWDGVAGLVIHPIRKAKDEGVMGFASGLAQGITGAVTLPVAGILEGAALIGEGMRGSGKNDGSDEEEEAVRKSQLVEDENLQAIVVDDRFYDDARQRVMEAALQGMKKNRGGIQAFFDAIRLCRKRYEGASEAPLPSPRPAAGAEEPGPYSPLPAPGKRVVKETEFYDVLGVDPGATQAEIKQAYFKLARQLHPDKHMGSSEEATRKFQDLGQAYQVLANPEARKSYDKYGKAALEDGFVDSGSLFAMAFGGPDFYHLIGQLTSAFSAEREVTEDELKEFQTKREQELATLLKARLELWVAGEHDKFIRDAKEEIVRLVIEPFGEEILQCVGYVYQHQATMLLGLHHSHLKFPGHIAFLRQKGHTFLKKVKAVSAIAKAAEFKERVQKEGLDLDAATVQEEGVPIFIKTLWAVSVLDIESTLRHVVSLVVIDGSVSKDVRAARAKGILKLGKIFQEV